MKRKMLSSLALLTVLVACTDPKPSATAKKALRSAKALPALSSERDSSSLAERLAHEGSAHPEARERVEGNLRALQAAGISFLRTRQALARPLSADYCAIALTKSGLGLSLCAFQDMQRAERGRALSQQRFDPLIPGRTLLVKRTDLLTITRAPSSEAQREAERIAARFMESQAAPQVAL